MGRKYRRVAHRCKNRIMVKGQRVRCLARKSMRQRWDYYIRTPKCDGCGSDQHWYVENHRTQRKDTPVCYCKEAYHFPHKPGSSVWCENHPTGPTEEDYRERYRG